MLQSDENHGLICGYSVGMDGNVTQLNWSDLDATIGHEDGFVWLHFNLVDPRVVAWIEKSSGLPPAAQKILVGNDSYMRLEAVGHGLGGVLADLHHDLDIDPSEVGVLRIYLDNHRLITSRRRPLRAVDRLRRSLGEGLSVARPAGLLVGLLNHLADTLRASIDELSDTVDEIEEDLFAGKIWDDESRLGRTRRLIAQFRRHLVPQQHALTSVLDRLPDWIDARDATDLRHAAEHIASNSHDLELVRERAALLHGEIAGRLAERTNKNLYMLTIVTTILLPGTLISGIFGMNVGGLPYLQSPSGFLIVMGGMLLTGLATVGLLRWKGMI